MLFYLADQSPLPFSSVLLSISISSKLTQSSTFFNKKSKVHKRKLWKTDFSAYIIYKVVTSGEFTDILSHEQMKMQTLVMYPLLFLQV